MKKKIFFLLLNFFVAGNLFAQCGRDCNWVVPDSAGINFSTSTPTVFFSNESGCSVLGDGHILESIACISDVNGNILFYSNGKSVYDRNNQLMLNGDSIDCDNSGTNSITIFPWPEHDSLYFLFYVNTFGLNNSSKGVYYSVINMNDNGGNGSIESNSKNKEAFLLDSLGEQIIAVRHGNGRDWWVIGKRASSYFKILVSPNGIIDTSLQLIGTTPGSFTGWTAGEISASRKGDKIATSITTAGIIEQMNFDRCSGQLSNLIIHDFNIPAWASTSIYGCCFSPDGNNIYCSFWDTLFQLRNNGNNLDITYKLVNPYSNSYSFYQMELAPNNIIYLTMSNSTSPNFTYSIYNMNLCSINNPDSIGALCDLQLNNFNLSGKRSFIGLPNMPNYNLGALSGSVCDTLTSIQNENLKTKNVVSIYPNPFTEDFQLSITGAKLDAVVSIYNIIGQQIFHSTLCQQNNFIHQTISLRNYPAGVYLVLISVNGQGFMRKVVKS